MKKTPPPLMQISEMLVERAGIINYFIRLRAQGRSPEPVDPGGRC